MPITGSQVGLMQCRSGIARCGATRSGYYTPNVAITLNGTDRTTKILRHSLRIHLAWNDEPDTATFTLKPNPGFTPTVGQLVVIGLGSIDNREFAGQIISVRQQSVLGVSSPFFHVEAVDWKRLFDRRIVTAHFESTSASTIAINLVATYGSGFTTNNVEPSLAVIDDFPLTNETLSGAFRRLASAVGGGFYIDAYRDVHLYGSGGETAHRAPTPPLTLTDSLGSLTAFGFTRDLSQFRSRVRVERQSVATAIDHVAGAQTVVLESGKVEIPSSGRVRILNTVYTYASSVVFDPPSGYSVTDTVRVAASVGDTTLAINDATKWGIGPSAEYIHANGQYLTHTGQTTGPDTLTGIPATGPGSIQQAIPVGTILNIPTYLFLATTLDEDIPRGTEAIFYVQVEDSVEQAALAAIEGGDGIHEHVVGDGRLNNTGATALGNSELDYFDDADGLLTADWETYDLNAKPGRPQVINRTALSGTVTILSTDIDFPQPNGLPRRVCHGGTVKISGTIDALINQQRASI